MNFTVQKCVVAAALTLTALYAPLALSQAPRPAPQVVKFGAILPLTGPAAGVGQDMQTGLATWAELANRRGAVPGVTFEVVFVDNRGQAQDALSGYGRLTSLEKVPAIVSSLTSPTLAMMPRANDDKVVIFNGGNGVALMKAGPYFFSNLLNIFVSADVMAGYAKEKLKLSRVATLYRTDDYGDGGRKKFEEKWKEIGGTVVASENFAPGTVDLRSQVSKIVAARPDAVFILGFGEETASAMNELARQRFTGAFLGDIGFAQPEITRLAGKAAEGRTYFPIDTWDPNKPANAEATRFVDAIKAKTNATPNIVAMVYYQVGQVLEQTVKRLVEQGKPVTGTNLKEEIEKIGTFQGVAGPVILSKENHFASIPLTIRTVTGGQLTNYEVLDGKDVSRYMHGK